MKPWETKKSLPSICSLLLEPAARRVVTEFACALVELLRLGLVHRKSVLSAQVRAREVDAAVRLFEVARLLVELQRLLGIRGRELEALIRTRERELVIAGERPEGEGLLPVLRDAGTFRVLHREVAAAERIPPIAAALEELDRLRDVRWNGAAVLVHEAQLRAAGQVPR